MPEDPDDYATTDAGDVFQEDATAAAVVDERPTPVIVQGVVRVSELPRVAHQLRRFALPVNGDPVMILPRDRTRAGAVIWTDLLSHTTVLGATRSEAERQGALSLAGVWLPISSTVPLRIEWRSSEELWAGVVQIDTPAASYVNVAIDKWSK